MNGVFIYHVPHVLSNGKKPKQRITVAGKFVDNGQQLILAMAKCRKGDAFSRKRGREIATKRLERQNKMIHQFTVEIPENVKPGEVFKRFAENLYNVSLQFNKALNA